jgi:hypothetical protein
LARSFKEERFMHALRPWLWIALAIAFGLFAPGARADLLLSPYSIPNPPSVGSASGTPVYASDVVTTQYTGLGLNFPNGSTAITRLNGVPVWAPVDPVAQPDSRIAGGPPVNFPSGVIGYFGSWAGGSFVSPGSLTPATVSSLYMEIIGHPFLLMSVYGLNGQPLNIISSVQNWPGLEIWRFNGSGIHSFSAITAVMDPPGVATPAATINPSWGVAEVSFTPTHTPEPASLVLGALGALSLAIPSGWRQARKGIGRMK